MKHLEKISEEDTDQNTGDGKGNEKVEIVNPYENKNPKIETPEEFPPYYLVPKTIWQGRGRHAIWTRAYEVQCNRKDVDRMRAHFAKMATYPTIYKYIPSKNEIQKWISEAFQLNLPQAIITETTVKKIVQEAM